MRRVQKCAGVLAPVVAMITSTMLARAQEAPAGNAQDNNQVVQAQPQDQPGERQFQRGPGGFRGNGGPGGQGGPGGPGGPPGGPNATEGQAAAATQPGVPTTQPFQPQPIRVFQPSSTTRAVKEISLNFRDAPIDMVLDYLSEAGGFTVVKQGRLDSRITLISKTPVAPDRAIELLNTALKASGYTAIQTEKTLNVMPLAEAIKANTPVHFGSDPKDIADTDEVITQVIPLRNLDANKLKTDLTPLINPNVTSNQASNALVVTDTSANIKRIVEIVHSLDRNDVTSSELKVINLKFANASQTAKLILSIFKPESQQQQQQQNNFPFPFGRGGPGGRGGGGNQPAEASADEALHNGHVNAVADDRTNSIVVTAPKDTLSLIEAIITKLDDNPMPASVMKAFPLRNAIAADTAKLLTTLTQTNDNNSVPFFGRFRFGGGSGSSDQAQVKINIAADDRTNTVIVTGPDEAIQQIGKLVEQLDNNPVASSELKVFPFKYGSASSAAKLITSTFSPTDNTSNTSGGGGGFRRFFFGGQQSTDTGNKKVQVTAASDDTTNTLVVTAPAEVMKLVEDVVKQLDTNPTSEETMFIYRLRNAQSSNLEYVLNVLFGNTSANGGTGQFGGNNALGGRNTTSSGFGNRSGSSFGGGGLGGGGAFGGSSAFGSSTNRNSSTGNRTTGTNRTGTTGGINQNMQRAATELTGLVFVVADTDTNSLLVTAPIKYQDQVRAIINQLDRPVPQVLIKVLVAEVTHDNSADFGVDFSILNQRPSGKGQTVGSTLGNGAAYAANGGLAVSLLETNLQATLHALAVQNKLDILSRPYILASDNQEAIISVGQNVPIVTDVRVTDTGQLIATPTYQQIGITLDVTPHINPDGLVILDVSPSIIQLTQSNVQIAAGVTSPIFDQRQAQSRVAIRDGNTIVIGGLMEDKKTTTVNKIPILGDIPLLGAIFSRTQTDKTKTELLLFLTPHVAQVPDTLSPMSKDELNGTRLTPNAVEPGTFQEQMKGMQRGNVPGTQPAGSSSPVMQFNLTGPGNSTQPSPPPQPATQPAIQTGIPPAQPTALKAP